MIICGIDEAGRGPIIGPLVICGVCIKEEEEHKLVELGVKDSKVLTAKQRERLFDKILKIVESHKIIEINPQEIDKEVESDNGSNLNWLEAKKCAEIINELKPDKTYIDCPSPNIPAYKSFLQKRIFAKKELVCAHHADANYPVVSAASIIAKVTRDERVDELKKNIRVDFGSGYIADPKTAEFVKKNWEKYPEIFRHSWAPYKHAAGMKNQKKIGEF